MQQAVQLSVNHLTLRGMEHVPNHAAGGKLPAAILFHGFTGDKLEPHRLFLKISRALEEAGVACFRFDFSGSGESDGNFEDMTLSGEVAEANEILDWVRQDERVDATRVSLIGLSMGGLVASLIAGDRPEHIHRLALMAPAGNMTEIVTATAAAVGADMRQPFFDYNGNLVGRNFAIDLQGLDAYSRAKPYTGPVLLVHGTKDGTVPCHVSEAYNKLSYEGRATLRLIEGADHTFNKSEWEQTAIGSIVQFVTE